MATGHQLSTLLNSSVKPPSNPKDGLPNTLHERIKTQQIWEAREDDEGLSENKENEQRNKEKRVKPAKHVYALSPRDPKIEQLAEDIDNLSDEQFFERLQELKAEHQKTLQMCEKAYRDKITEVKQPNTKDTKQAWNESQKFFHGNSGDNDGIQEEYDNDDTTPQDHLSGSVQRIRNMWNGFEVEKYAPRQRPRPSSASGSEVSSTRDWRFDDEDTWSPMITVPKPFKMTIRESTKSKQKTKAQERIEQEKLIKQKAEEAELAKKFKASPAPAHIYLPLYDEITEKQETKRQLNHKYREELLRSIEKPFKFHTREETKKRQKINNALYEVKKRERKNEFKAKPVPKVAEEAELAKKFKASPAPAHIYLPLYDEITEKQETKRQLNHKYREELLRSIEKPFKFHTREETKKRQKINNALYEVKKRERKNEFKAKPVPKILKEDVTEKMAEEEEYRKIRMRMRAEELLRESQLPPSMDAREKSKELNRIKKLAQELRGLGISSEPSFRPKITHEVPDFEEAHRKLQKNLANRKAEQEATVTKPFNLRTSRILSNKDKIIEDIVQDEHQLPETRWPYLNSRTKPSNIGKLSPAVTSDDRIPSMTTQSTELRKSITKKRMTEEMQKELERLEAERKRRQKEKKLKAEVMEKASANDIQYGLVDKTAEKLQRYREEEKARAEEYKRNLREMQDRVNERPLLFETVAQKNARLRAEKKYNDTLKKAGVSGSRLQENSQKGVSNHRADDSDENEDFSGSYRAPLSPQGSQRSNSRSYKGSRARSDSVGGNGSRPNSAKDLDSPAVTPKEQTYSDTFTKDETGLSDGDFSEAESIPSEDLEMA